MLGPLLRQRGDQRHGGRAAADHHDPLAGAVEVGGPVLGVDDLPAEVLAAGEGGGVALVVAVVAGAHVQEAARELQLLAGVGALHGHRPAGLLGGPARADRALGETDHALDPVGGGGLVDVPEDRGAVSDPAGILPRAERVAHREHVGVRADPRVAEQVPGAADRIARLEDRERELGKGASQMARGSDPRQAGAEDQDVEVLERLAVGCHEASSTSRGERAPA